jgi:hypothetical protein
MNHDEELLPLRVIADEDPDFSDQQIRRGINSGVMPVIALGEKGKSYQLTRSIWRKFKRGDHIPDRYFLKSKIVGKGAA